MLVNNSLTSFTECCVYLSTIILGRGLEAVLWRLMSSFFFVLHTESL